MYTANLYSQGITAVGEPLQNSQTLVTPKGVIFNNKSIGMNIFNFSESGTPERKWDVPSYFDDVQKPDTSDQNEGNLASIPDYEQKNSKYNVLDKYLPGDNVGEAINKMSADKELWERRRKDWQELIEKHRKMLSKGAQPSRTLDFWYKDMYNSNTAPAIRKRWEELGAYEKK